MVWGWKEGGKNGERERLMLVKAKSTRVHGASAGISSSLLAAGVRRVSSKVQGTRDLRHSSRVAPRVPDGASALGLFMVSI